MDPTSLAAKEQGDITEAGRRKLLADAVRLAWEEALCVLQRDAGDLGGSRAGAMSTELPVGPRVTLQELWAPSCWWDQE